jgi:hypothetical protein
VQNRHAKRRRVTTRRMRRAKTFLTTTFRAKNRRATWLRVATHRVATHRVATRRATIHRVKNRRVKNRRVKIRRLTCVPAVVRLRNSCATRGSCRQSNTPREIGRCVEVADVALERSARPQGMRSSAVAGPEAHITGPQRPPPRSRLGSGHAPRVNHEHGDVGRRHPGDARRLAQRPGAHARQLLARLA